MRDARRDLERAGLAVVGISPDAPSDQKKFWEKLALGFPLLSDPDHRVASIYGAWGEKIFNGKTVTGILRSSFLIDPQGKVSRTWYPVKPEDTVPKALEALGEARSA